MNQVDHKMMFETAVGFVTASLPEYESVAPVVLVSVIILMTNTAWNTLASSRKASALKERAAKRRDERDAVEHKCLDSCHALENDEYFLSATEVSKAFREGRLNEEVYLKGLIRRTRDIGKLVLNAVTEELYDDGLADLKALTKVKGGGLFKGIPVSIKECVAMKGCDATCGAASKTYMPQQQDAALVTMMRKGGMVPFVRTNVPQLLLLPETENGVWGKTSNPWDLGRTPGGSSGGESALIASGCSVAGLGSDIGGSIRIPAHFTGIVGFKPTPGRISRHGMVSPKKNNRSGQQAIQATAGPMARSVPDCIEMMASMCDPAVHDIDLEMPLHKPFDKVICTKKRDHGKLRIGVMITNDYFEPCLTVKRSVQEAADALRKQGHEVVELEAPTVQKNDFETFCAAMSADGNWFNFMKSLDGEALSPSYSKLKMYTGIPNWLRKPLACVLTIFGEIRKADLMAKLVEGGMNVRDYWERMADLTDIATKWAQHMEDRQLDAIIMPTVALPAPKHGAIGELMVAISYCTIINVLHWPSGVVPITTVREDEAHYDNEKTGVPMWQRDSFSKLADATMEGSAGLPVGVQVVTPKWQDERCLFVMNEIEEVIQFNKTNRPNLNL